MKNKYILLVISSFLLVTTLNSCNNNPTVSGHSRKNVYYNNLETGNSVPLKMDFFDSNPYVVYVPISEYQRYVPSFTMSVKRDDNIFTFTNLLNHEKAYLNAASGELSYDAFSKFTSRALTPHIEIYHPALFNGRLVEDESTYLAGETFTIDLSTYNLKPIQDGNEYYLPLDVLMRIDPLTNKGTAYFDGEDNVTLLYNNNLIYYAGKKVNEYPSSFYEYSFDLFAFDIDLYYGLNGYSRPLRYKNNESFIYNQNGAMNTLDKYKSKVTSAKSTLEFDQEFASMFIEIDDGGHTTVDRASLATDKSKLPEGFGMSEERKATFNAFEAENKARENVEQKEEQQFDKKVALFNGKGTNDIGYLTLNSFAASGSDDIQTVLPLANSTFNKYINNESKITDIVIDIANNGGGATVAEGALLSWITRGKAKQVLKDARDHSVTTIVCQYDINGDKLYDKCDYIPEDVNIYILTDATYSAACALAFDTYMYTLSDEYKTSGQNIKFIGKPNYGGACSITNSTLMPTAFSYHMSSNAVGVNWYDMNKTCDEIMPMSEGWEMSVDQIANRTGYINLKIAGKLE